jgi:soluble lytic murein transglycosylase-like protein
VSIAEVGSRIVELQTLLAQASGRVAVPTPATAAATTAGGSATAGSAGTFASALGTAAATAPGASPASAPFPLASMPGALPAAAPGAAGTVPAGVPAGGSDGGQYAGLIQAAAQRHGIDPQIFTNLVRQESGFDPNAGSPAGARGLCQLMPGTAASLGVTDVTDPAQSLEGGAKYLRQQLDRFGGDYTKALAAYNAGPGAVQRHGGVPPYAETQHYVATILGTRAA